MHLQIPPQNTLLLWQLNSQKNIGSIPELLRCCTIIVMTLNLMHVQVFRLRRKSHSLLDDPRSRYVVSVLTLANAVSRSVVSDIALEFAFSRLAVSVIALVYAVNRSVISVIALIYAVSQSVGQSLHWQTLVASQHAWANGSHMGRIRA